MPRQLTGRIGITFGRPALRRFSTTTTAATNAQAAKLFQTAPAGSAAKFENWYQETATA